MKLTKLGSFEIESIEDLQDLIGDTKFGYYVIILSRDYSQSLPKYEVYCGRREIQQEIMQETFTKEYKKKYRGKRALYSHITLPNYIKMRLGKLRINSIEQALKIGK